MMHSSDISLDESTKDTYEIDVPAGMQTDDDFPDGGFIAWSIVCGVRLRITTLSLSLNKISGYV